MPAEVRKRLAFAASRTCRATIYLAIVNRPGTTGAMMGVRRSYSDVVLGLSLRIHRAACVHGFRRNATAGQVALWEGLAARTRPRDDRALSFSPAFSSKGRAMQALSSGFEATRRGGGAAGRGLGSARHIIIRQVRRAWARIASAHSRRLARALRRVMPEVPPAYSRDWGEAAGEETLLAAAARHLVPISHF